MSGEPAERETTIRRLYGYFNSRELDRLLPELSPDVDWPNAIDGGRVRGRNAVRDYWLGQFEQANPRVEPSAFREFDDGRLEVRVHQVLSDLAGDLIGQGEVLHVYEFDDSGLVTGMEIVAPADERTVGADA